MSQLNARFLIPSELDATQITQLFRLFERYYAAIDLDRFKHDLADKNVVLALYDRRQLVGFTTIKHMPFTYYGHPRMALFSGDTIIDQAYWGQQLLALAWCYYAGRIKANAPRIPLYWFLIVKGHRTYRLMTLFSRRCFPHWREPTPNDVRKMMTILARQQFGSAYDEDSGVVRFQESHGHLRSQWAEVTASQRRKPDIDFFLDKNPGFATGEELVCLTELCASNMRSHARRAFVGEWQP